MLTTIPIPIPIPNNTNTTNTNTIGIGIVTCLTGLKPAHFVRQLNNHWFPEIVFYFSLTMIYTVTLIILDVSNRNSSYFRLSRFMCLH
jgi:hypothetical protein